MQAQDKNINFETTKDKKELGGLKKNIITTKNK